MVQPNDEEFIRDAAQPETNRDAVQEEMIRSVAQEEIIHNSAQEEMIYGVAQEEENPDAVQKELIHDSAQEVEHSDDSLDLAPLTCAIPSGKISTELNYETQDRALIKFFAKNDHDLCRFEGIHEKYYYNGKRSYHKPYDRGRRNAISRHRIGCHRIGCIGL